MGCGRLEYIYLYAVTSNDKTFDHNVTVYTNNIKRKWVLTFFYEKSVYRYIMVNPLLKCETVYTSRVIHHYMLKKQLKIWCEILY